MHEFSNVAWAELTIRASHVIRAKVRPAGAS